MVSCHAQPILIYYLVWPVLSATVSVRTWVCATVHEQQRLSATPVQLHDVSSASIYRVASRPGETDRCPSYRRPRCECWTTLLIRAVSHSGHVVAAVSCSCIRWRSRQPPTGRRQRKWTFSYGKKWRREMYGLNVDDVRSVVCQIVCLLRMCPRFASQVCCTLVRRRSTVTS